MIAAPSTNKRFDAAVGDWLARCERHGLPFDAVEAARAAYDDGRHIKATRALVALRILFSALSEHADPEADDPADFDIWPILLLAATDTGYQLGFREGREHQRDPRQRSLGEPT